MRNFKFKILNFKNKDEGLTIVEALVALMVLSLGLIPPLAVLSSSIRLSALIKNNLIAANLAQEGVEVVRAIRDANWFANGNPPWDQHLNTCNPSSECRVEWDTDGTPWLSLGSNPPLKFDSATGRYNYSTGVDTSFKRKVSISMAACNCELVVISTVEWPQSGKTRTISVESHLYNWR